jgi:hypothetical protein
MIAKLFVIGLVAVMCSLSSGCARDTIDALSGDSDGYGDIRPQLGVKDLEDAGFVNPTSLSTSQDLKNDKLLFRVWYGVCAVDLDMDPFFFTYHRRAGAVDTPVEVSTPADFRKIPELRKCRASS